MRVRSHDCLLGPHIHDDEMSAVTKRKKALRAGGHNYWPCLPREAGVEALEPPTAQLQNSTRFKLEEDVVGDLVELLGNKDRKVQ